MDKCADNIKELYRERLINRENLWPPCNSGRLVRLELVERKGREGYSAEYQRGRDDSVKRTFITREDVFKVESGKKPVRKVLVEGDAGIDKTALCTSISEDWANGKILTEFRLLLLLPLRQKEIVLVKSLSELLRFFYIDPDSCKSLESDLRKDNGKRLLIIVDGWDESFCQEGTFLHKLLFGLFLPFISRVLTSRPSASAQLYRSQYIDRYVEIHGFNKDSIIEYIQSEFTSDHDKADRLLKQLEHNPLVESVCSVPLNCAIVCHLWRTLEEALPTTMTELYTKIVLNFVLRSIKKG